MLGDPMTPGQLQNQLPLQCLRPSPPHLQNNPPFLCPPISLPGVAPHPQAINQPHLTQAGAAHRSPLPKWHRTRTLAIGEAPCLLPPWPQNLHHLLLLSHRQSRRLVVDSVEEAMICFPMFGDDSECSSGQMDRRYAWQTKWAMCETRRSVQTMIAYANT